MLHEVMKKRTPLPGIQPGRGLLEALGGEAPAREGAERTGGLVGEHARAAAHLLDLDGGCFRVFEGFELFRCEKKIAVPRIVGERKRRGWNLENQRAGREIAVLLLRGPGEDHFLRRAGPLLRDAPAERERALGARLRDAGLLLQRDRDERVRARGRGRPARSGEPRRPVGGGFFRPPSPANANTFSRACRRSGHGSAKAINLGRATVASRFLRRRTSSVARRAISDSAPARKGERINPLALAKSIG